MTMTTKIRTGPGPDAEQVGRGPKGDKGDKGDSFDNWGCVVLLVAFLVWDLVSSYIKTL